MEVNNKLLLVLIAIVILGLIFLIINAFKKEKGWFVTGIIIIILAVIDPFLIMLLSKTSFSISAIGNLGTLGDFFGGTTVGLFSLASILFVIHTIGIQRSELELTRKEFEVGNKTAKVQQIDNAFFNMLSLHHQIVNNITITKDNKIITGRETFSTLKDICKNYLARYYHHSDSNKNWYEIEEKSVDLDFSAVNTISQAMLDEVYEYFHKNYGNEIGHYMRNNYRIVKYIVENVVETEEEQLKVINETGRTPIIGDRRYYFGMLRAQWSNAEFELILINSLFSDNYKFKNLILLHDVLDIEDKKTIVNTENNKNNSNLNFFKLKDSMKKFQAFKSLIEVSKNR